MTLQNAPSELRDAELDLSGGVDGTFKFFCPNEVTVDSYDLAGKRDIGTGALVTVETRISSDDAFKYSKIEI